VQAKSKAVVYPCNDVMPKKEKSQCNLLNGDSFVISVIFPQGTLVDLVRRYILQIHSILWTSLIFGMSRNDFSLNIVIIVDLDAC
jgi:hypothetical protein